jgi:hypothetical protein
MMRSRKTYRTCSAAGFDDMDAIDELHEESRARCEAQKREVLARLRAAGCSSKPETLRCVLNIKLPVLNIKLPV